MTDNRLREQMCLLVKSLFDRGHTAGSSGNISARTEDGGLLVSPTGSCFGRLNPATLSRFDADGRLIGGHKPTKEMALHTAFYAPARALGPSCIFIPTHSVALSLLPEVGKQLDYDCGEAHDTMIMSLRAAAVRHRYFDITLNSRLDPIIAEGGTQDVYMVWHEPICPDFVLSVCIAVGKQITIGTPAIWEIVV